MKKKVISLMLCAAMMVGTVSMNVVADDATDTTTEATTEATTETTTEATTTSTTTKDTTTTTKATTTTETTTAKQSQSVTDSRNVSISIDGKRELSDFVSSNVATSGYTWSSSDKDIATVTSSGRVTGIDDGSCTITATATANGVSYKYTFYITIEEPDYTDTIKVSVDEDDTVDLYDELDEDDIDNIKAKDFTWKSDNTKYAKVSSSGVVTGVKEGSTTVTAYYNNDGDIYNYLFKITIDEEDDDNNKKTSSTKKVSTKTSWTIYINTDDDLDISDLLEDDPDDYDWEVSNEDIVEVDENDGVLTGLEEGSTKVYAEGDEDYTFTVKVNDDYSNDDISVKGSKTYDLEDILDDDVDEYDFSSDRTDVATVNSSGIVTGKANGVCSIVCKHEDGDVIQVFVTVSGVAATTTTTTTKATTEATTETTTQAKATTTTVATPKFNDISQRAWAVEAINNMAGKGFIVGRNASTFAPDATCSRADFTIVLTKIFGFDSTAANSTYADVKATDYYYKYVVAAKELGIEAGVSNNTFRPTVAITREEIMVMTYKALVKKGVSVNTDASVLNKYTDVTNIAAENKEAVAALVNAGIVTGTSDTILDVKSNITRAQMAVLLNNVYNMK